MRHGCRSGPRLRLTSVMENSIEGSCNLEFAKQGAHRLSSRVYNAEANSTTPAFCKEQTDSSISSSDRDSSVRGCGGALYEVMSAGRQLLSSDGLPIQSRAVMSSKRATMSCRSRPSGSCFLSPKMTGMWMPNMRIMNMTCGDRCRCPSRSDGLTYFSRTSGERKG